MSVLLKGDEYPTRKGSAHDREEGRRREEGKGGRRMEEEKKGRTGGDLRTVDPVARRLLPPRLRPAAVRLGDRRVRRRGLLVDPLQHLGNGGKGPRSREHTTVRQGELPKRGGKKLGRRKRFGGAEAVSGDRVYEEGN